MSAVLAALRRHAAEQPDAPALIGASSTLDYRTLSQRVERVASEVFSGHSRRCGLLLDNGIGWAIADLAARSIGVTLVPIPTFFSPQQIAHVVSVSGIDTLIADAAPPELEIVGRDDLSAVLEQRATCFRLRPTGEPALPGHTSKVTFTSGTTGTAKGVCLSDQAMDHVARSLLTVSAGSKQDRHLCLLPLATLLENIAGIDVPILAGAASAIPGLAEVGLHGSSSLDPAAMLAAIEKYAPTTIVTVPQTLAGLLFAIAQSGRCPKLRLVAVGGAPLAPAILAQAEALGVPVYQGYGLSELSSVVAFNGPGANRIGSVGKPLPHVGLRFAADGEILVKGAVFEGYLGQAAAGLGEGEYWPTGDLGHLDADGYLHIDGRKKNMFITAFGRNVAPEWIECALTATPAIAQAAVFGEARPWNAAVIVLRNVAFTAALEADIRKVNDSLPDYAQIRRWVVADEAFSPLNGMATANGRQRREAIFARYRERLNGLYEGEAVHVS